MKPKVLSGIQPSGNLHIGNYIGALSSWTKMQEEYENYFMIVNEHAITVPQNPKELLENTDNLAKIYIAAGLDTSKVVLFKQSDVNAHTHLGWLLNTITPIGWLNRMTQFKDKAGENRESVGVGLFDYPVLMAADILLYDTDLVPVGDDQKQHVELTRDIAEKFNKTYGKAFTLPKPLIKSDSEGSRIMSLTNPLKKMSKSDKDKNSCIYLLDNVESAKGKILRAVTDSQSGIKYDPENRPGISNLLVIYSQLSKKDIWDIEKEYENKGYKEFKEDLANFIGKFLSEFQEKYNSISNDEVTKILEEGKGRATAVADKKLQEVKKLMGLS